MRRGDSWLTGDVSRALWSIIWQLNNPAIQAIHPIFLGPSLLTQSRSLASVYRHSSPFPSDTPSLSLLNVLHQTVSGWLLPAPCAVWGFWAVLAVQWRSNSQHDINSIDHNRSLRDHIKRDLVSLGLLIWWREGSWSAAEKTGNRSESGIWFICWVVMWKHFSYSLLQKQNTPLTLLNKFTYFSIVKLHKY